MDKQLVKYFVNEYKNNTNKEETLRMKETVGGHKTIYTMDEYLSKSLYIPTRSDIFVHFKKSIIMWELFQQILQEKMSPNQFLVLYGMKKSLSMPLDNVKQEVEILHELEMLKDNKLTVKGKRLIDKFENYFVKAKKKTNIQLMGKKFATKLNEYREVFPAGKLPSGKPARVNVRTLENSFRWFFETYDFSWDEIIGATKMYVNSYEDNQFMYMKTSQYFITKEDKNKVKSSDLADYCDMIRDGVQPGDNHFKEKVV
ncbi:MAG: hypothetical protein H8E16_04385 [Flavobacteriales bacterium]|nr:hypothetical protein [Flavobacteriales bacterium]